MNTIGKQLVSNAGSLVVELGTVSASDYAGPWALKSDGVSWVEETASVPATAVFANGMAFTTSGALYVTTDAVSDAVWVGGRAFREDGAMFVSYAEPEADDVFIGGTAVAQTGASRISVNAFLLEAMTTQPDGTRAGVISDLIKGLMVDGVWVELDSLYILAAHDEQAALLDWKLRVNLSAVNSPTFEVDRGFTGDAATSRLTRSGIYTRFVQDSASMWFWSRTDAGESQYPIGRTANPQNRLTGRSAADSIVLAINDGTLANFGTGAVTSGLGFFGAQRRGATDRRAWQDGAQVGVTSNTASTGVNATANWICGANSSSFSAKQVAAAAWGASLSGLESDFYDHMLVYMQAVGAA